MTKSSVYLLQILCWITEGFVQLGIGQNTALFYDDQGNVVFPSKLCLADECKSRGKLLSTNPEKIIKAYRRNSVRVPKNMMPSGIPIKGYMFFNDID